MTKFSFKVWLKAFFNCTIMFWNRNIQKREMKYIIWDRVTQICSEVSRHTKINIFSPKLQETYSRPLAKSYNFLTSNLYHLDIIYFFLVNWCYHLKWEKQILVQCPGIPKSAMWWSWQKNEMLRFSDPS